MSHLSDLLDNVKRLHEAGTVKLSESELSTISRQTAELIEKSKRNKKAEKMPEGFGEVLMKLDEKDPESAYMDIVEFLKENGVIKDKEEKKEEHGEKGEKKGPHHEMKGPKEEESEKGESPMHEKMETPEEEKKEHGGMPFGGGKEAQAEPEMTEEDNAGEEGSGKARLKDLQNKIDAVPATTSVESMGMMDEKKSGKYRVLITAERNLVAHQVGKGPLFHAIPNEEYKRNPVALKRLANQVMANLLYKGPRVAASLCGTSLLAGVDEGVVTTGELPIDPNKDAVTDGAETVSEGGVDAPATSALDGADNDTKEDPDTINPTNREGTRKPARYEVIKKADTSIDKIETDTQEKPEEVVKSVTDGAENVSEEDPEKPENDTTKGGEVDFQSVEASYRQLYSSRAKKLAEKAVEDYAQKFATCLRIASYRMRLNQDAHPFKVAAADVLLSDNVEFTDGDKFVPMDVKTASELIELIASEGHDQFVDHLIARSIELMDKDAKYLSDVESDLRNLAPIPVDVVQKQSSKLVKPSVREKAIEGSLSSRNRAPQRSVKTSKHAVVRESLVGNGLGRRLSSLMK